MEKIEYTKNALREIQTIKFTYEFDFSNIKGREIQKLRELLKLTQYQIDGMSQKRASLLETEKECMTFYDLDNYQKTFTKRVQELEKEKEKLN